MKVYGTQEIRNLSIVGHGDAGKTSLVAAMIYASGVGSRLGRVDEGTAPTDYDEEEISHKLSLNITPGFIEHSGTKINLIDTPGYAAFIANARPAVRVAEIALLVVDAVSGIGVQTEKAWEYAEEFGRPKAIVINKLDKERADFGSVLDSLRETFGRLIVPLSLPIGREKDFRGVVDVVTMQAYEFDERGRGVKADLPTEGRGFLEAERERLIELVAESDDSLMEKFFESGTLSNEELITGIKKAIVNRTLVPLFAASSQTLKGISTITDSIVDYFPNPASLGAIEARRDQSETETISVEVSDSQPPAGYVFRTVSENFGKITILKINSGSFKSDATLYNLNQSQPERLGPVHYVQGKQLEKVTEAHAGDIIAVSKLKDTRTGDTLCDKAHPVYFDPVSFPEAAISYAIEPKSRHDEDKLSGAIHKILDEDPQLHYDRDEQT
ncbi:MAG TPA: GTP-binding protein, partial [Blastocatellia bacterium]|nr:GTP-binding protein [Blastocatellia bacterium]